MADGFELLVIVGLACGLFGLLAAVADVMYRERRR